MDNQSANPETARRSTVRKTTLSALQLRGITADTGAGTNRLVERTFAGIVNLRFDPSVADKARGAIGLEVPLTPNKRARDGAGNVCYWLGPDEWLVVSETTDGPALAAAYEAALDGEAHSVVDLSSNYDCLRLSGPNARDILARTTPLDLSAELFTIWDCAQTIAARANVLLTLVEEDGPTFELLCRRSFAQYLWDYLRDSGKRFGLG